MRVLLLVTWLTVGQQAVSYQVDFASVDACLNARAELLKDEQRLKADAAKPADGRARAFRSPALVPALSVVCVQQ